MSVAAVVVSYNRIDLLRKCLAAVSNQTRRPDEIILVDNGSTDGSQEMVRNEFPGVRVFETGKNLGGAGGFAWGIELAIAAGHELAWLMDDDAEPKQDSLAPLLDVFSISDVRPGFAASAVEDFEGNLNAGHLPAVEADAGKQMKANALGCVAITHATFVGVVVDLKRAAAMPLPYADFFIWLDDAEYTRRLASETLGLCVPTSKIMHPSKASNPDMGGRLFYFVRNQLWLAKLKPGPRGLADSTPYMVLALTKFAAAQFPHAKDKLLWLKSLAKGLFEGALRSPRAVMPGELLAQRPANPAA